MANLKISQLTAAGALTGSELVEIVQSGTNKQTTTQDIADLGSGGGGAVDSVNGQTGVVVLDAGDITNTPSGNVSATDVQTAINELDAEIDSRIAAAIAGIKWKTSVRAATTVAGTLASDFENGDSIDGVTLATGNRILLKNQADQTQNGIYTVNASGAPTRSTDADAAAELESAAVTVDEGTSNANTTWLQTTDSITIGVSNIVWTQYGSSVPDADPSTKGIAKLYTSTGASVDGAMDRNSVTNALALKDNLPVRNDVTLANGVVTIDWSAGDIQNLTISEAKVITTISNPVVGKTIILLIPGTNSLTFSGLTAVIEGTYEAGVANRIYIQCLKVSGGAEYRITYDHDSSPFPFSTLTDGATVTWTVASLEAISNRLLTIGGNRTLALSGALSGYSGNVKITASGSDRTITIPAGTTHRMKGVGDTTVKTVTIPIGETYIFTWLYDGTNYDWWYID